MKSHRCTCDVVAPALSCASEDSNGSPRLPSKYYAFGTGSRGEGAESTVGTEAEAGLEKVPDGGGYRADVDLSVFADSRKSAGLTRAPRPGSVPQYLFVGEMCGLDSVESHNGCKTT